MHVYEDHVHCYGCGFHGDVVDVWAAQKGIDRPIEAALDLAREFNVRLPEINAESRQRAEERRQKEADALEMAQCAHAAMEELDTKPVSGGSPEASRAQTLDRGSCSEALVSDLYHRRPSSRSGIAAGSWV